MPLASYYQKDVASSHIKDMKVVSKCALYEVSVTCRSNFSFAVPIIVVATSGALLLQMILLNDQNYYCGPTASIVTMVLFVYKS